MKKTGGACEIITPEIGGVTLSDGSVVAGDQMIGGGPSVLYDAVALIFGPGTGKACGKSQKQATSWQTPLPIANLLP